jgi:uncharacterized protein YuzE
MRYIYDDEADALYVYLREDGEVARSVVVDEGRTVDFGPNGEPVGIEVLGASAGIRVADLNRRFDLKEYVNNLLRLERAVLVDP